MRLVWMLGLALPLAAQLRDFAVTDDGTLLFTTNLRLRGEAELRGQSKIYHLTGGGIALVAAAPDRGGVVPPGVSMPFTSGDGGIRGYTEYFGCGTPSCGFVAFSPYAVHVTGAVFPGGVALQSAQISRNGRFALLGRFPFGVSVFDVAGQRSMNVPASYAVRGGLAIANDGTALVGDAGAEMAVWHPDRGLRPLAGKAVRGAISPDGRLVAYEREPGELVLYTVPSGETRVLTSRDGAQFCPSFANDGTLLYLEFEEASATLQPVLLPPGGEPRRLITVEEGVQEAILAGWGHIAWLLTGSGRLLRAGVTFDGYDTFVPETPLVSRVDSGGVPGSRATAEGTSLTAVAEARIDDTVVPITEAAPQRLRFQIPWEFAPRPEWETLALRGRDNPFEQLLPFQVYPQASVAFERQGRSGGLYDDSGVLQMAHQDFRGLVTVEDPAEPGETVHLFAVNLGPVDRRIATGEAGPSDPPARVLAPVECALNLQNPRRVELPFVGLTGGVVGLYQIDLTVPDDWPPGVTFVRCSIGSFFDQANFAVGPRR